MYQLARAFFRRDMPDKDERSPVEAGPALPDPRSQPQPMATPGERAAVAGKLAREIMAQLGRPLHVVDVGAQLLGDAQGIGRARYRRLRSAVGAAGR